MLIKLLFLIISLSINVLCNNESEESNKNTSNEVQNTNNIKDINSNKEEQKKIDQNLLNNNNNKPASIGLNKDEKQLNDDKLNNIASKSDQIELNIKAIGKDVNNIEKIFQSELKIVKESLEKVCDEINLFKNQFKNEKLFGIELTQNIKITAGIVIISLVAFISGYIGKYYFCKNNIVDNENND